MGKNRVTFVDNEKSAIVSVPPGRVYFRYVVDGDEQYDPDKPSELFESTNII